MTSNLGSALIRERLWGMQGQLTTDNGLQTTHPEANSEFRIQNSELEKLRGELLEMLKQTIKPEFLNRIDETIMFLPLNREEIAQVVRLQINSVCRMLAANDISLRLTEKAVDYIAEAGYDPEFGARPVKRAIQNLLLNVLSTKILGMEIDRSREIVVDANAEGLTFTN
jgi:ATP-dependent Clp protease ATP-binding subunit ClpB